ncbi:uncharacterized protein LOC143744052 [Siphateles boraxobius]|uniref:uncharacterized protein LOC143744052 n=1 Tax=Siphateles boraxobius TaxID=180520 RepID=UPI0040645D00
MTELSRCAVPSLLLMCARAYETCATRNHAHIWAESRRATPPSRQLWMISCSVILRVLKLLFSSSAVLQCNCSAAAGVTQSSWTAESAPASEHTPRTQEHSGYRG